MIKKYLIFVLFVAVIASQAGGVLSANADNFYRPLTLTCSASTPSVSSGENVSFTAFYNSNVTQAQLTWSAVGGNPSYGNGASFNTRFYTNSINETRLVTVSDGYETATCNVYVYGSSYPYTPYPTPYQYNLRCSPANANADANQRVTFSASGGDGNYHWYAPDGTPTTGDNSTFRVRFDTNSPNTQYRTVTLTSAGQSTTCAVMIYGTYYTPYPTPYQNLQCTPSSTTANPGDLVYFNAYGGNGSYSWRANEGTPSSGRNQNFSTRFYNNNSYTMSRNVTVTSGGRSATCYVTVRGSTYYPPYNTPYPTPYYYPPYNNPYPTPFYGYGYGYVTMDHTVTNMTRSGSGAGSSVTAYNGDRLQFTVRITSGNQTAQDVHIRDWLPQYMTYVFGSTRVNGSYYQDGIATGAQNSSLALGALAPNQTMVVSFDATVSGASNVTLTNSVNVHTSGTTDQNRTSSIYVTGGYNYYQTPTYYPPATYYPATTYNSPTTYYPPVTPTTYSYIDPNARVTLTQTGRNVTRGQTGEHTNVAARNNDTLELIIHAHSTNSAALNNTYVTDLLPGGLVYIPGSTTVNGNSSADGVTSSGILIGTLQPYADAVVKFSVRVDGSTVPTWGTVTINNTAQVRAEGLGTMSVQQPISLGENLSIAAISGLQTGPMNTLLLALLAALVATGGYALYTRTHLFDRRLAHAEMPHLARTAAPNFVR